MSEQVSKAAFSAVMMAIFLDILGFGLIIPLLPFMVDIIDVSMFKTDAIALGWITAIYSIVQFIMSPIWGRISDQVGRRPIILIGILGSSLSFFSLAFSKTIVTVMLARGLQGFFTAASLPTARAFVADTTPVEDRAKKFGFLGAAFGFGFAFGPIIGGFLSNINVGQLYLYAAPSIAAGLLSVFNFLLAYRKLEESLPEEIRGDVSVRSTNVFDNFSSIGKFFAYPGAGVLLVIFGIFNLAFSGFETVFTKFIIDIDASIQPDNIGLVFGLIGGIAIIVQVAFVGPVTRKIGDDRTLLMALIFLTIGFLSYLFIVDLISLMLLTIPIAIGASFFSPSINSSLSRRIPKDQQGGGLGINSSLGSLGRVFGPLLFTSIYRFEGDTFPFISSATMMLGLAMLVYLVVIKKISRQSLPVL